MIDTDDRAGIEEQYAVATNATSLKVDPARRTRADVIVAAGMVNNQLGHALIHLRASWDKADKPRKWTPAEIAKRAAEIPDKKRKPDVKRARVEATVWHARAMREVAMNLPGRNLVMGLLKEWAIFYGVEPDLLSPALYHWLAPKCPVCDGHGKFRMPDAPALSNKSCGHCQGAGTWPRPLGAERIHAHIRSCVGRVRGGIAQKLHG